MTKQELENNLLAAVEELRVARSQLEPLAKEWALADTNYRQAQWVAYQSASGGTVPEKKAYVDNTCSDTMYAAHAAEALKDAAKENVRAIEVEISAYQTLAGLLKSEMALEGRYET